MSAAKSFLAPMFFLLFADFAAIPAFADIPLRQICGPNGHTPIPGSLQAEQLCRAAYLSGNAWVIYDNNTRVRASILVVNGQKCISGNSGACSTAIDSAHKAMDFSDAGDDNLSAAKVNGRAALDLIGSVPAVRQIPTESVKIADDLPEACGRAGTTGLVQDRIQCAIVTDPTLPPDVKDPQFLKDFEETTGKPLQEVINKSNESLMQDYAKTAAQNAMNRSNLSTLDFMKGVGKLAESIMGRLTSERSRNRFADKVLPTFAKNILPESFTLKRVPPTPQKFASASPEIKPPPEAKISPAAMPSPKLKNARPAKVAAGEGEEDPELSADGEDLFLRVSKRYQLSKDKVKKRDWALPMNQWMGRY